MTSTTRVPITVPGPPRPASLPIAPTAAEPPPFALPGEHFAAALLWLALGAAGLISVAPDLARGNLFAPRVLATTHAFTLGVITTSIFGALYQLFPVTLGVAARSVRAGHATFWVLQLGIVLLASGFWFQRGSLQGAGWLALAAAVGALASNLIRQRRRATQGRVIGAYISAGHAALGTAMLLGFSRIGETLGWWQVDRLAVIASHFHLAALGFAGLTAVGVGSRMLPMFLMASGYPEWPLRWIGPLGGAGMVAFAAGELTRSTGASAAGGALMAAAALLHGYLVLGYFRTRLRRRLDPGLGHVAVAFGSLAIASLTGLGLLLAPGSFHLRGWAAYALVSLLGWLVLLIIGIYYRILPFLTWLHLFGPRMGEPDLPTVADLTRPGWGWASLALLVAGLLVLVPSVAFGAADIARAGAVLFALGVGLVLAQAARVLAMRSRA